MVPRRAASILAMAGPESSGENKGFSARGNANFFSYRIYIYSIRDSVVAYIAIVL